MNPLRYLWDNGDFTLNGAFLAWACIPVVMLMIQHLIGA